GGGAVFVALCHLRRGSIAVRPGQAVRIGERLADCGNSGNSTEPHLHLQAMSAPDPTSARAVPFTFPGGLPRGGRIVDGRGTSRCDLCPPARREGGRSRRP